MNRIHLFILLSLIALDGCGGKSSSTPATNTTAASGVPATTGSQFGNATFGSAKF